MSHSPARTASEHVLGYWAVLGLGAVATGLNGWWSGPELAYGIGLTEPVLVLADAKRAELLRTRGQAAVGFDEFGAAADARGGDGAEILYPGTVIDEDDPAVVLFTSGTTGRPKGATLSHRNVVYFAQAWARHAALALARSGAAPSATPPVALVTSPFFHVSGAANILATGPFNAGTAIFPPPGRWDETAHLELMARHRITRWSGVPTQYWRILDHPGFGSYDLTAVTALGCGGANLAPELLRRIRAAFPGAQVANGYGMAETFGAGTVLKGVAAAHDPASVGTPIPLTRVRVRRPDGTDAADGEVRRDPPARPRRLPRLLARPGRHGGCSRRGTLVPHRRFRTDQRRRPAPGKPDAGPHHPRRREHLAPSRSRTASSSTPTSRTRPSSAPTTPFSARKRKRSWYPHRAPT
ncbi:AMP-binding protein [Yinghuangia aomiensis]